MTYLLDVISSLQTSETATAIAGLDGNLTSCSCGLMDWLAVRPQPRKRNSQLLPYCHVALGSTATTASCPVCRTGAEGVVAQVLSREQRALARQACGLPLKAWSQGLVPCKAPSPVREGVCSTTVGMASRQV